jgi:crotonobetaine/carnitine-CoA ligase
MYSQDLLPAVLSRRAASGPAGVFLEDVNGGRLTYREVDQRARLWAGSYRGLDVAGGELVATMIPNGVSAFEAWMGLAYLGAVEVPVSVQYFGDTLVHVLNDAKVRIVVADEDLVERIREVERRLEHVRTVVSLGAPVHSGGLQYLGATEFFDGAEEIDGPEPIGIEDTAAILYTSGTTGRSKGVIVPWGQVHSSALGTCPLEGLSEKDSFYIPGPASHIAAKSLPSLVALIGGRLVLRHAFKLSAFWDDITRYQITTTLLLGSMGQYLAKQYETTDPPTTTLRNLMMAPVFDGYRDLNAKLGTRATSGFNMTELSNPITWSTWDQFDSETCGLVRQGYPFYECRIVDELDQEVTQGQVGELIVRTREPWTMNKGYLNSPAVTVEAWRNGWFHTGDAFRQNVAGEYFFVDRLTDSIRRRGENISSLEVEEAANRHPEVAESAAIGVPAEYGDHEVKLYVVAVGDRRSGVEIRLHQHMSALIPAHMVPRYIEFVEELPKTATHRVRKSELRKRQNMSQWDSTIGVVDRIAPPAVVSSAGSQGSR